jgi:hypothetical protein
MAGMTLFLAYGLQGFGVLFASLGPCPFEALLGHAEHLGRRLASGAEGELVEATQLVDYWLGIDPAEFEASLRD